MEITNVKIKNVNGFNRLRAIVSITFDDAFVVHELKIIEGDNGLFVAMPTSKTNGDKPRDVVHPINIEMRQMIEDVVISKYNEQIQAA